MRRGIGLADEILEIAGGCDPEVESVIRANLAVALAHKGQVREARAIVGDIRNNYTRAFAYVRLAEISHAALQLKDAERELKDEGLTMEERACLSIKIAEVSRREEWLQYAIELADLADGTRTHRTIQRFLVGVLARTGRATEARARAAEISDERVRVISLAEIAGITGDERDLTVIRTNSALLLNVYLKRGNFHGARSIAAALGSDREKAMAFLKIAVESGDAEDLRQAENASADARQLKIEPMVMCEIGIASAKVGDEAGARRIAAGLSELHHFPRRHWLRAKVLTAIFEQSSQGTD